MNEGMKLLRFDGEEPRTIARAPSPQAELKHFQNVIGNVTADALTVWAEIWGELQEGVHTGITVAPEAGEGLGTLQTEGYPTGDVSQATAPSCDGLPFKPSCGWPEFMEKMWLLRHYLDFLARFSRQGE